MENKRLNIILLNLIRGFLPSLLNLCIALAGVHHYGGKEWGKLVGVLIILFFYSFIANWGNKEYLIRIYSKHPSSILEYYFSSLISRSVFLVLSLSLFFIFPFFIALLSIAFIICQFIYYSFDSLIVYHQKFKIQLITELLGFSIVMGAIISIPAFTVEIFLMLYLVSYLIKVVVLFFYLKTYKVRIAQISLSRKYIVLAAPFFLVGLSGFLHSKIDIYMVNFFLSSEELSHYQILITAFLMLQGISALLIQPFTKFLYRINKKVIRKLKWLMSGAGILIVPMGSFCIWYFLSTFTGINFHVVIYLIIGTGALPVFFYTIDIFSLYRENKEKIVVLVSFLGAIVNCSCTIICIKYLGIMGAVIGISAAQWVILLVYKLISSRLFHINKV